MGLVTITTLTANQANCNNTEFNQLVTPLQTEVNGNLSNVNIASDAAIAWTKINSTGAITNTDIKSTAAIALSKLAALTSAYIIVGNGSSVATAVAVSGDVTMSNAGATTVTDLTIASEAEGDILKRGASVWERLAKGTALQFLQMNSGATAPEWASFITAYDYATSASSSTERSLNTLKIAFGSKTMTSSSTQAVTNLPFTSATSYMVVCTYEYATGAINEGMRVVRNSASQLTLYNDVGATTIVHWLAIGV